MINIQWSRSALLTPQAEAPQSPPAMIQIAWLWLRHQPKSALTLWFHERTKAAGGRNRRVMIVALARKLLAALWKFVTTGVVPEGAIMSAA